MGFALCGLLIILLIMFLWSRLDIGFTGILFWFGFWFCSCVVSLSLNGRFSFACECMFV